MLALFQSLVTLPEPLHLAILAGLTFVFGLAVTAIGKSIPWLAKFLGQYVDEVAMAVSGAIVVWLNSLLAQIPPAWEGVGVIALQLIVAVLAALGLIQQVRKFRGLK